MRGLVLLILCVCVTHESVADVEGFASNGKLYIGGGASMQPYSGFVSDTYVAAEAFAFGAQQFGKWFWVGGRLAGRADILSRNDYRSGWQAGNGLGLVAGYLVGINRRKFHFSIGGWLQGDSRNQPQYRLGGLPIGSFRLRIGSLDKWYGVFRVADSAAFDSEGAVSAKVGLGKQLNLMTTFQAGAQFEALSRSASIYGIVETRRSKKGYNLRFSGRLGSTLSDVRLAAGFTASVVFSN